MFVFDSQLISNPQTFKLKVCVSLFISPITTACINISHLLFNPSNNIRKRVKKKYASRYVFSYNSIFFVLLWVRIALSKYSQPVFFPQEERLSFTISL